MELRPDAPPPDACQTVVLADGNEYLMLRPRLEMVTFLDDGRLKVRTESPLEGYDAGLKRLDEAEDDGEFVLALVGLTLLLMRPCYEVDPGDVPRLFRFAADGDLAARLHAVAMGRAPAKN